MSRYSSQHAETIQDRRHDMRGYEFYDQLHAQHAKLDAANQQLKAATDELSTLRTWSRDAHAMLRYVSNFAGLCPECLANSPALAGPVEHTARCRLHELIVSGSEMKLDRQEV